MRDLRGAAVASESAFKTCGSCGAEWPDWRGFVHDPSVRLLGLQSAPGMADANTLVFEHRCGSTVSVLAYRLRSLLGVEDGVQALPELYGTDTCHGHCRSIQGLALCDRPCSNARDRRLTLHVANLMGDRVAR